jgi:hypothetical protein
MSSLKSQFADEFRMVSAVCSPFFLVCLVAIILILARGRQLHWTALCGFILLLVVSILQPIVYQFMMPRIDTSSASIAQVNRMQIYIGFSIGFIYVVALSCLLHAFIRLVKRLNADFPEASGE